jgi:hypothetical protein
MRVVGTLPMRWPGCRQLDEWDGRLAPHRGHLSEVVAPAARFRSSRLHGRGAPIIPGLGRVGSYTRQAWPTLENLNHCQRTGTC